MDIIKRREDLDQPSVSAQESQYTGPRALGGNSAVTGGSGEHVRGPAGAEVFPYRACRLTNPKYER